jgi:hypothetical protein
MASPREKGKISHAEWPAILQRHRAGESLASIARDYHCTAPAIRYIVRRQPADASPEATGDEVPRIVPRVVARPPTPNPPRGAHQAPAPTPEEQRVITPELYRRIHSDIASFLVALDTALDQNTRTDVNALHDAADRLMRATARMRIELEQQQALAPLTEPTRDPAQRSS